MAKFQCNFISYTLKRAVDITVVIPSVTIPEALGMGHQTSSYAIPKRQVSCIVSVAWIRK